MKNILKITSILWILLHSKVVYWLDDAGILWWGGIAGDAEACITAEDLKNWDMHLDDFPCIVNGMINIFMGFAATLAVIFIIVGAYQILFGSLEWNKTKGKETITMALGGFALAAFSWLIIKFILNNFT